MSNAETQPKKAKIIENQPETVSQPDQQVEQMCAHFVKRKKRFCKMTVSKGKQYCGEHEGQGVDGMAEGDIKRIPCPLDPKHSCYKRKLQKHLQICNARKKEDVPAYVIKDVNVGGSDDAKDYSKLKLSELEDVDFYGVVDKVKELHAKFVEGQIEKLECKHSSLNAELSRAEYGKESRKHLLQASALLGILEHEQQLNDDTSFLEYGAGKGQLAFYLAQLLQGHKNSKVVLLDRMSLRHKKDNKIEDKSLVHRIRVDIADFKIDALELLHNSKRLVAVSKHLCGAATDLTLRCITQTTETPTPEKAVSIQFPQTEFVMIALCCHHRCDWSTFVGKEFFCTHNVSVREFVIITKMVSWAICGSGMSRERRRALEEQTLSVQEQDDLARHQRLSLKERESIGFMCKRILDYARVEFLRQHQYEASLKFYVDREVTLENVCLLAKKIK